jgi:hypothetical protein
VRKKSKLGAACCGLVMVVAGCGGGTQRLSAPDYAREASKLCRRANHSVAAVALPPLAMGADASHAMVQVVVVQRDAIDELRSLRAPDRLTVTVQKWIALLDQGADELELMAQQVRAGHHDEALAYGAKAMTLLDRARELVTPLGVTSCQGPVLPTV